MTSLDILKATYAILPKKHQRKVIGLGILMLVVGFSELVLAGVISLLGVALSSPESLHTIPYAGNFLQNMPIFYENAPVVNSLVFVLILVVTATIVKNLGTAFLTYKQTEIGQVISWDVGQHIFKKFLYAPYLWHTLQNTPELQGHLGWRFFISNFWIFTLTAISQATIMLCLMLGAFIATPLVSLLLYGVCGSLAVLTYKITRKRVRDFGAQKAQLDVDSGKVSYFALQGMREVHMYNQREPFLTQYANYAPIFASVTAKQSVYSPLPQWVLETAGLALLLGAVILMQWQNEALATITGTLTLMAGISWRLLPAMNRFVSATLKMKENFVPSEKVITMYLDLEQKNIAPNYTPFTSSLQLENVHFSYPCATHTALENINITIQKGSMIGLVGLSGAGKSTLVNILTGLYSPTEGAFKIDGESIEPKPGFLHIGYVPQSPYIMDATLAQNIAFSDWGKDIDEERVLECCRMAAITFLDDLSDGIHTQLGERGIRLSGGQMQRVAIARALYTKPNILLFDEATSALDGAAEAAIQNTILNLRENMTIVMIAHRLTTVEGCDHVYWLHEGKLHQVGNDKHTLESYKQFLEQTPKKDRRTVC